MEPKRCQEQVGPSRIELRVEPRSVLLTVFSVPTLIRVPAPVMLAVLRHLLSQFDHFLGEAPTSMLGAC